MKIAVLAGGASKERDVSLLSGAMVARALRSSGNEIALVDSFLGVDEDGPGPFYPEGTPIPAPTISVELPDPEKLRASRKGAQGEIGAGVTEVLAWADITFNALHGGDGENGRIQAFMDMLGFKYTGDGYLASALAMHKDLSKLLFERAGIPVPKGDVACTPDDRIDPSLPFPQVVKPCAAGSSVGVTFVNDEVERRDALLEAFKYDSTVLVEEALPGREFSVGVLGGSALPVIEILPKEGGYDYANKYQAGRTTEICPAQITDALKVRLQDLAERACAALGVKVCARGEFRLDEAGEPRCLEMNTLPGLTPVSLLPQEAAAAGMSFEELCERIVLISLKKYEH